MNPCHNWVGMKPPPRALGLGVRPLAVAAVAIGASVLALPIARWVPIVADMLDESPYGDACLVVVTALLTLGHARFVLGAQTTDQAIGRSILGGAVAGVLDSGFSLGLLSLLEGPDEIISPLFCLLAGLIGGLGVGMPIGLVMGLVLAVPLTLALAVGKRHARDGADVMTAGAGLWLMSMGALALWIGQAPPWTFPVIGAGGVLALGGSVRVALLSRWVRRVEAGREPGLTIVSDPPQGTIAPLLHTWAIGPVRGAVVRQPTEFPTQAGAYREAGPGAHVAYLIEAPPVPRALASATTPAPPTQREDHSRHDRAAGFRR